MFERRGAFRLLNAHQRDFRVWLRRAFHVHDAPGKRADGQRDFDVLMIPFVNRDGVVRFDHLRLSADDVGDADSILAARQQFECRVRRLLCCADGFVRVNQRDFQVFCQAFIQRAARKIGHVNQHFPQPNHFDDFLPLADHDRLLRPNRLAFIRQIEQVRPFAQARCFQRNTFDVVAFHFLPDDRRFARIVGLRKLHHQFAARRRVNQLILRVFELDGESGQQEIGQRVAFFRRHDVDHVHAA